MKTKFKNTLWLTIFTSAFLISNLNNVKAQDDIYYVPAKKSNSTQIEPGQNLTKDTSGMTDYERYRSYRDGYANKKDNKSDSAISHDELAKKKGMAQYGGRSVAYDSSSDVNNNQNYSEQPSDVPQEGTTIINNYNNDDGYYYDRFSSYHRFYFGYDPFWYDYYDPFCFGYSWGYPYFGVGLGFYSPYYGYDPYYYRPYGYGYYGGHGYYNHNNYNNNGYVHSGGARRSFGTYSSPSIRRSGFSGNQTMVGTVPSGRRSSVGRAVTPSDNYGATYDGARRRAAWQTYQTTSTTNVASTRSGNVVSRSNYNRNLSVPTTRLENNSKGYSPSYSVPGNSTRRSYNSSGNNNTSENQRRSYSSGSQGNNRSYSQPSYSNSGNSSSQPRRSSESYSAPARSYSSPSSSSHNSSSGYSGGSSHSSGGSSSSGSSGHSSGGGGGGGHRR